MPQDNGHRDLAARTGSIKNRRACPCSEKLRNLDYGVGWVMSKQAETCRWPSFWAARAATGSAVLPGPLPPGPVPGEGIGRFHHARAIERNAHPCRGRGLAFASSLASSHPGQLVFPSRLTAAGPFRCLFPVPVAAFPDGLVDVPVPGPSPPVAKLHHHGGAYLFDITVGAALSGRGRGHGGGSAGSAGAT